MSCKYLIPLIFFTINAQGQKLKKEDKQLITSLEAHVSYLASDKMEGRRTGTAGEQAAAAYISNEFKKNGLAPKGSTAYFQEFEIREGKQIAEATLLLVNDQRLALHKDFFPLSYSGNAAVEAMPSMALQERGMPWFLNLKEMVEDNATNPHFDLPAAVKNKVAQMQGRGATAVFVYNTAATADGLAFDGKDTAPAFGIPVVYVSREARKKYFDDETASFDIKVNTAIGPKTKKGTNVLGYIDNGAAATIVLGAHYDHLGWGEDGNSLVKAVAPQIHNGADDNASGTAALIELGRLLKLSKNKQHNYLFIAFSGEELGLLGSRYFVEHATIDLRSISYMINMDMIGRLNVASKLVTVGGFGTSPTWSEVYRLKGKSALYASGLSFRFDSSGTGPSDHSSFYRKDIPVLFYFTGLHSDYHKPSDDAEKLNYTGEMHLVRHIISLLDYTSKKGIRPPFTKTKEQPSVMASSFSVTLGIMPDYSFNGSGVKADGISENRPAQKAGLRSGDIITALGAYPTQSIESYMQALGKFKKGEKTTVFFSRGTEKLSAPVEF